MVVWSIVWMITILLISVSVVIYYILRYDHYFPNDSFLNNLNIGDPDASKHKRGFTDAEDIVDWFKIDRPDDWRQRD